MPHDPGSTTPRIDGLDNVGVAGIGSSADDVYPAAGNRDRWVANPDDEPRQEPKVVAVRRGEHTVVVACGRSTANDDELSVDCNRRKVCATCGQLTDDRGSRRGIHALIDIARSPCAA